MYCTMHLATDNRAFVINYTILCTRTGMYSGQLHESSLSHPQWTLFPAGSEGWGFQYAVVLYSIYYTLYYSTLHTHAWCGRHTRNALYINIRDTRTRNVIYKDNTCLRKKTGAIISIPRSIAWGLTMYSASLQPAWFAALSSPRQLPHWETFYRKLDHALLSSLG